MKLKTIAAFVLVIMIISTFYYFYFQRTKLIRENLQRRIDAGQVFIDGLPDAVYANENYGINVYNVQKGNVIRVSFFHHETNVTTNAEPMLIASNPQPYTLKFSTEEKGINDVIIYYNDQTYRQRVRVDVQ